MSIYAVVTLVVGQVLVAILSGAHVVFICPVITIYVDRQIAVRRGTTKRS